MDIILYIVTAYAVAMAAVMHLIETAPEAPQDVEDAERDFAERAW